MSLCGVACICVCASRRLQAIVTYCLLEETEILKYCFFVLDRDKVRGHHALLTSVDIMTTD